RCYRACCPRAAQIRSTGTAGPGMFPAPPPVCPPRNLPAVARAALPDERRTNRQSNSGIKIVGRRGRLPVASECERRALSSCLPLAGVGGAVGLCQHADAVRLAGQDPQRPRPSTSVAAAAGLELHGAAARPP